MTVSTSVASAATTMDDDEEVAGSVSAQDSVASETKAAVQTDICWSDIVKR